MIKVIKERKDLSLDKLSVALKNPPQNVFISIYTKKVVEVESVGHSKGNVTLNQVIEMIKRLESKADANFSELRQDVKDINTRLDGIDARLDYNNLRCLPNSK